MTQTELIQFLKSQKRFLCVKEIAELMQVSPNSVSRQVRGLVKSRMILMREFTAPKTQIKGKRQVRYYSVGENGK